jgi:tight adherence protein C
MSTTVQLLRSGALVAGFAAVALLVYCIASAPSAPASQLGIRGVMRTRALRHNPLFARLEPLLRWLGVRIRPFLGDKLRARIDRLITLAGDYLGLNPEEFLALCALSSVFGTAVGAAYYFALGRGLLYVVLGCLLGAAMPYLQLSGVEQSRRKRCEDGLPSVIDLLALGLSAGLDFPSAVKQVIDKSSRPDDPIIEELNWVLQDLQVGKTRVDALSQFAERAPVDAVRELVGSVVQAEQRGNPLAHALEIQADASRKQRSSRAEESAAKASVKMLVPMFLLMAAILLLVTSPMIFSLSETFK